MDFNALRGIGERVALFLFSWNSGGLSGSLAGRAAEPL
jgi:hypothetical protein